ncbi:hypothetical protein GGC63_004333 [Paenibacillus sp. OAS669]|nr:hypothetical protein [Paenibacillus sp. OAS669]
MIMDVPNTVVQPAVQPGRDIKNGITYAIVCFGELVVHFLQENRDEEDLP